MNGYGIVLIGIFLGSIVVLGTTTFIYYQKKRYFYEVDLDITKVENELLENIREIGVNNLLVTPAGQELHSLLSEKELIALGEKITSKPTGKYVEEIFHWKEAICTGLSLIGGIALIISGLIYILQGSPEQVNEGILNGLSGILLFTVSVAAFNMTDGWKRANDLPTGKKIVAYLPVLATGSVFIVLLVGFYIVESTFKNSYKA
jgi:hypothetical protein